MGLRCPPCPRCTNQIPHTLLVVTFLTSLHRCDKSAWYGLFVFSVSTVLAQVMLTARFGIHFLVRMLRSDSRECRVRMHAITLKHLPITVGFSFITLCQLVLGVLTISLVSMLGGGTEPLYQKSHPHSERLTSRPDRLHPAEPVPQIPLDAYRFCVFVHHKRLGITVVAVALLYGT